ncbi:unnamed protein product [Knipowitschia caucasica]
MEAYTVAGAPLSYSDLYSMIPYNSTFPDDYPEALRNDSGGVQRGRPVRSAGDMAIAISITALYSVICVVGLLGNILVMYGVVR